VLWPCVHCECCDHACTPPLRRLVVVHCECCGHACTPPLRRLVVFTSIAMSSLQPASPFDSTQGKRSLSAKPFCILLWLLTLAVVDMLSHANTHMCGLRLMPRCPPPAPPPPPTHTHRTHKHRWFHAVLHFVAHTLVDGATFSQVHGLQAKRDVDCRNRSVCHQFDFHVLGRVRTFALVCAQRICFTLFYDFSLCSTRLSSQIRSSTVNCKQRRDCEDCSLLRSLGSSCANVAHVANKRQRVQFISCIAPVLL
jgi:hypothetical protein